MSLLLDALNRASKEKQKAAAAAAQATTPTHAAPTVPAAVSVGLMSAPVEVLTWEELPRPTPDTSPAVHAEPQRPEPPVLTTAVGPGAELELTLVGMASAVDTPIPIADNKPTVDPALSALPEIPPLDLSPEIFLREPAQAPTAAPATQVVPAVQPEAAPAVVFVPSSAPTPAAFTPREPTLETAPPPPPPPPPVPVQVQVQVPAPPAAPAPAVTPTQAKSVPDGQKAQDIRRAYEGPANDARTGRRRAMALGGLAVGLALAFGSVFLGLWGDPAQWIGGTGLSKAAPPIPVAVEEPVDPGAVPAAEPPVTVALSPEVTQAPVAKPLNAPKAALPAKAAPRVSSAARASKDTASNLPVATAPKTNAAESEVNRIASPSSSPVSTSNEVVVRADSRTNPNFVAKTRGPSALERGYSLLLEGRMDDAAAAYNQALRANPDERDALLGMAYISQQKGQRDDAQVYFRRVLRQEPNNTRALAGLQALDSGSDTTLTASRAGELAARQPDSAAAMAMAGNAYVRDGLLSSAVQAYARAQTLEPTNPLHAYNHAVALDRLGRYAAAAVQYERVLTLSATAPVAERAYQINDVRLRLAQLRQALTVTESAAP